MKRISQNLAEISPWEILVLFLWAFLLSTNLTRGLWLDEWASLDLISDGHFFTRTLEYNTPPLYYILLRIWGSISHSEIHLRVFSLLLSGWTLLLSMKIGSLFGKLPRILFPLLLVTSPPFLRYSLEIRAYMLLALSSLGSLYYAIRWCRPDTRPFDGTRLCLCLCLCVLTHTIGALTLLAVATFLLYRQPKKTQKRSLQLLWIPIGVYFVVFVSILSSHLGAPWWNDPLSPHYLWTAFGKILYLHTNGFFLPPHTLLLLLLGVSALSFHRENGPLFAGITVYLCSLLLVSLFKNITLPRTLMPLVPWILLWVSIQIDAQKSRWIRRAALVLVAVIALNNSLMWATEGARVPIRSTPQAMAYIDSHFREGDKIVVDHSALSLFGLGAYYSSIPRHRILEYPTGPQATARFPDALTESISTLPEQGSIYWIVFRSYLANDPYYAEAVRRLGPPEVLHFSAPWVFRFRPKESPHRPWGNFPTYSFRPNF